MKRRIINSLGIVAIILLFMGCGAKENTLSASDTSEVRPKEAVSVQINSVASQDNSASENPSQADGSSISQTDGSQISEEEAKSIALKDAGLTDDQVSSIRIKLGTDDGVWQYEVEFYADNKEYDYDIDAASGKILSKDMDIEDDFRSSSSKVSISEDDAKKIALKKVSGATEQDIRIHLDNDDGKMIYEGSIVYKEREYEFEIDANSGNILEWEEESIYD